MKTRSRRGNPTDDDRVRNKTCYYVNFDDKQMMLLSFILNPCLNQKLIILIYFNFVLNKSFVL